MLRRIIKIDEEKCNGCGACASACHEGAIEMVNGKAKLTREDYCDGLGDCLPACPADAISFEEREEELQKKEKQEKFEQEQRKKSPYNDFIQLNNNYYKEEDWLIENNTLAYRILKFLMHHMDGYNAVMCSYKVLEDFLNKREAQKDGWS